MSWPANTADPSPPRAWRFLIELDAGSDALVRTLGPFAHQGAEILRLTLAPSESAVRLEVEAGGLDPGRADHLRRRLAGMPAVRSVSAGWR